MGWLWISTVLVCGVLTLNTLASVLSSRFFLFEWDLWEAFGKQLCRIYLDFVDVCINVE